MATLNPTSYEESTHDAQHQSNSLQKKKKKNVHSWHFLNAWNVSINAKKHVLGIWLVAILLFTNPVSGKLRLLAYTTYVRLSRRNDLRQGWSMLRQEFLQSKLWIILAHGHAWGVSASSSRHMNMRREEFDLPSAWLCARKLVLIFN
jgi:hypothetical protein